MLSSKDFLDCLESGDAFMAERGFIIDDALKAKVVRLIAQLFVVQILPNLWDKKFTTPDASLRPAYM